MKTSEIRYLILGIAGLIMVIVASVPIANNALIWTASWPFIVALGSGVCIRSLRHMASTSRTRALMLLHLLLVTFSLFLSIIVVLNLFT